MDDSGDDGVLLPIGEVARRLRITVPTARKWVDAPDSPIPAVRTPGKQRRVRARDLERYERELRGN